MKLYIICVSLFFSLVTSFYIPIALDSCPYECGDVKIPYPFGIKKNCSLSTEFLVNCNQSFSPPRPVITIEGLNLYIRRITLSPPQIHVYYDNKIYKKSLHGDITALKAWKIGNQDCIMAKANQSSYACKEHGECRNSAEGDGYTCICSVGYRGNPYLSGGCTGEFTNGRFPPLDSKGDVVRGLKNCKLICTMAPGGISCSCQQQAYWTERQFVYYTGDNSNSNNKDYTSYLSIAAIAACCMLFTPIVIYNCYCKRRRNLFLKKISERRTHTQTPEIIRRIDMLAGCLQGRFVTTNLEILDLKQIDVVVDRIVSIYNNPHSNIQKLQGCCLETGLFMIIPRVTLIFELFGSRSLFHYLHENDAVALSLKTRIRVAAKVADAIALLHSWMPEPIVYREMKSSNILLDNSCNVKVSIQNSGMWHPLNKARKRALVKEKSPYLDPEFSESGTLTDKSDVYGYGVLLAELLTGKNPMTFHTSNEKEHLSTYFLRKMKEIPLLEILDPSILTFREEEEQQITSVAELAVKCLATKGDERPSMKDIVEEFKCLILVVENPAQLT